MSLLHTGVSLSRCLISHCFWDITEYSVFRVSIINRYMRPLSIMGMAMGSKCRCCEFNTDSVNGGFEAWGGFAYHALPVSSVGDK